MIYDTGASSISMSDVMAAQIGLKPKKGDSEGLSHIADGSIVPCLNTIIDSVTVGKFTVKDVKCSIDQPKRTHTIGYWDKPGDRTITNWVGVVTPRSICEDTVYPKEQALIDICKKQKADGRQTWVYVQMTNKRNIQPRLKKLIEAEGLKVGILRSGDVDPKEREEWIIKQGKNFDVMLSHPQLVSTGLDLFSKSGSHNYSTLVFYETGYNLFTMRQASRRAWRIGQPLDCRVYYLYYLDSMQHKAMSLMSKKMAAAQALEGEFSADGLAAMAGDDNLQMSMAKSLADGIDEADLQRNWVKIKSGGSKKLKQPMLKLIEEVKKIPPSQLDDLPIELQAVAETIIEVASKKPSAEVLAEIDQILASQPDDDFEDFFGADDDFDVDVELTPEIMAKMFANLMANA